MIYGSVCSGIEAATVAWHPMGWRPAFFSEIEAFPNAVLKHYYPDVPNYGDMLRFKEWPDAALDVLVGGTPCQSFSVAGLRKGLDDPRGNLTLVYLALAARYRPEWVVWENVPGVLSDGTGAFGAFLGGLGQLGYGFAYRVLDAQHFGVSQRRRRVFVVGCLGGWQRAAAVLFERESLSGNPPPSREAGQGTPARPLRSCDGGIDREDMNTLVAPELARCIATREGTSQDWETTTMVAEVTHSLRADGFDASEDGTGRGTPLVPVGFAQNQRDELRAVAVAVAGALAAKAGMKQQTYIAFSSKDHGADAGDTAPTLRAMGHAGSHPNGGGQVAVAFQPKASRSQSMNPSEVSPSLGTTKEVGMQHGMQVRRLTPRECERLQGFPDDYTLIPYRRKPASDGPRYKALGNSMAVPVMRWIGERIQAVAALEAVA